MSYKQHKAFTLIELIFVIVVMGILAKFGIEFLSQAYEGFIFSKINNKLQSDSAYATEFIAKRLEYRIKRSVIYRDLALGNSDVNMNFLGSGTSNNATVLEWISTDIDGFRDGTWSGVIDFNPTLSNATQITSLNTNTQSIDTLIKALSNSTSGINDTAIYFVGTSNIEWGWDGNLTKFDDLTQVAICPVEQNATSVFTFRPPLKEDGVTRNIFTGVPASEYYKLAWTAYAVSLENYNTGANAGKNMGDLFLYYNYQPWKGEQYDDNGISKALIANNVSSFQYRTAGSLIKIQVCTKSDLIVNEDYSLCKEKTVY